MRTRRHVLFMLLVLLPLTGGAYERPAPAKIQIADGIVLFKTASYGEFGLDGNSIAILGSDGVLVFDTNGTPSAAAAVLAEIRKLTDRPVRYIVNSHWHWDHWYGTEVYKQAFPDVQIISHEKTRTMMMGPALAFNRPGIETQLPEVVANLEKRIAAAESANPQNPNPPRAKQALEDARFFLQQKTGVRHTFPTRTFSDRLDLEIGDREIRVLNYGRAITPGDALLHLPKEKILIAGDLLINPITFALSCYPTEWLTALEKIDALDAVVIVPGHGDPLRDETLLHATMDVLRVLLREGKAAKEKGLDPDAAKEAILPGLRDLMVKITGDAPARNDAFKVQLVDWFLHRVYDELNGPLTDDIAPIPPR